jgi:hypothetical protein
MTNVQARLQGVPEQLHHEDVIVALLTAPDESWDPSYRINLKFFEIYALPARCA